MLSGPNNKSPFPFAWGGAPNWEKGCEVEYQQSADFINNCGYIFDRII